MFPTPQEICVQNLWDLGSDYIRVKKWAIDKVKINCLIFILKDLFRAFKQTGRIRFGFLENCSGF